jgi:hypothetical protein
MTLKQLIARMRSTLDDKGGTNGDWTADDVQSRLRWDNEELAGYINAAERETALRTQNLIESESVAVCRIAVTAGTDMYKLHPKLLFIQRAKLDNELHPLSEISWRDAEGTRGDWDTYTARSEYYIRDLQKGKIRLYPTPIADGTLRFIATRLPLSDMELDSWEADEPELDEQYHEKMLSWAFHLAYQKDEPNTLDPDKVLYYSQKFDMEIGLPVNMYAYERRKRKNRGTGYAGIHQTSFNSADRLR